MTTTYTVRYRPIGPGDEGWTEVTGVTGTSHALTGLTAGVRYEVQVLAVSAGGSSPAVVAQRSTRCAPPARPTVLPAGYELSADDGDGTNGALAASWSTVTGAVAHRLRYRVADGPGAWVTAISPSTGTEVFDTTATNIPNLAGTASFDVEVAAVNQDGDLSAWSPTRAAVPARIATGGTVTSFVGNGTNGESGTTYVVHAYGSAGSSSFTLNREMVVSHLVVGGGAGGGYGFDRGPGGGGGAGGLVTGAVTRGPGAHAITVGAGGAGGTASVDGGAGGRGGDSAVGDVIAIGGGPGGASRTNGQNGGSGGGSGGRPFDDWPFFGGVGGQGNAGAGNPGMTGAGGGGGAGGKPSDPTTASAGAAGAGLASSITGTAVTYATGGAGGSWTAQTAGTAASSSRGDGGSGASSNSNGQVDGGAGGSGVVVLRYALPVDLPLAPPTGVTALPVGRSGGATTGAIDAVWDPVTDATFEVRYRHITPTVGSWTTVDNGATASLRITGLDPDRTYEVSVTATVSGTTSAPSQPVTSAAVVGTGGTVTTIVGTGADSGKTFIVHRFPSSGFLVLNRPLDAVEHLIVAGGGAGGSRHGGGGGGGGVLSGSGSRTAEAHAITVGTGGAGPNQHGNSDATKPAPGNGGASSLFGLTALGGGAGGGAHGTNAGATGGSGGGSAVDSSPGSGTSGQGNAGGMGLGSPNFAGGGGGGAAAAGGAPSGTLAANTLSGGTGGAGVASAITGTTLTYGGGGGGSMLQDQRGTAGGGGAGGGGAGGHRPFWELFDTLDAGRWELYNTDGVAVGGSATNHPNSRAQMDELITAAGAAASRGRRSAEAVTTRIALLDWTNQQALAAATGISYTNSDTNGLPNRGNNFAFVLHAAFVAKETKTYEFTLSSDDSADLFITTASTFAGVDPVVSHYGGRGAPALGTTNGSIALVAGTTYRMRVRQHDRSGGVALRLFWRTSGTSNAWLQDADEIPVVPEHPANSAQFDALVTAAIRTATGLAEITSQTGTSTANILNWTNETRGTAFSGITFPNTGNRFALVISGTFVPTESGTYTFTIAGDDAVDLTIGETVVTSHYGNHGISDLGANTGTIDLTAGRAYAFRARHQDGTGGDGLRVLWRKPSQSGSSDWFQDATELTGAGRAGTDGLGGGGGGGGHTGNTNFAAGDGGDGTVVVRYALPA